MRKRSLKMAVKRLTALTGALVIGISTASWGAPLQPGAWDDAAVQAANQGEERHLDSVPYSQRVYERYDPAVLEQAMAEFEAACQEEGREEEVGRLYDVLISEYDRLSTLTYMAQIAYDRNISDPAAVEEQAYTTDLYADMSEKLVGSLQRGLDTSYYAFLSQRIGADQAPWIKYYEPYTQEELSLREEEDRLIREYETLALSDTRVDVDGETWTYDRLENEASLTEESYGEIQEALSRERNLVLGSCLLELAAVRRSIADLYGYDSYSDYAYEIRYGRDYTLRDISRLYGIVKEVIVPLYDDFWYADMDYSSYDGLDKLENRSAEEVLDAVGAGVLKVDGDLGNIFRYMRENELCDIQGEEPGMDRVETSYTVRFPSYGDGYMFVNRENTFRDYQAVVHEFGHFSAYYYDTAPELYSAFGVDVMEIQSMGLELLVANYAEEVAGEGGEAYAYETVNDMFYNIVTACMFNEFEETLYGDPDVELEDLNRKFSEIQDSYEGWYFSSYEGQCYDWVDVPHIFYDPLYYIAYGTASLTALDLWTLSQKDMEGAVDTYMGIIRGEMDLPYRETAHRWGLRDIFDEAQVIELAAEIREYYDLEAQDYSRDEDTYDAQGQDNGEEDNQAGQEAQNTGIMPLAILGLMGIGTVIVLQLALMGMAGVIIWLLVKNRGNR